MKIETVLNNSMLSITTETSGELYQLGRIAVNTKTEPETLADGEKCLEIPKAEVVRLLAR